jgi:hypothetical protein
MREPAQNRDDEKEGWAGLMREPAQSRDDEREE